MRASNVFGALAAIAVTGLFAFACGDSLHLDPGVTTGTGGMMSSSSTGTVTTSTGTGGQPTACRSNPDCTFPTPVCDTSRGLCVGCLKLDDCTYAPGTVCSHGACVCPDKTDSFCEAVPSGAPAHCAPLMTSSSDCGTCGHACFGACNGGKCADPWEPTSIVGAPGGRSHHVAVWTGKAMIVWGGYAGGALNSGGIYDPATGKWTPTSQANAPSPRYDATAVWTGSAMIVYGGNNGGGSVLGDGGIFDPVKNSWTALPTDGAPSPRTLHTAVWADEPAKMIVWGGQDTMSYLGTGGVFDPKAGTWASTSLLSAPQRRHSHRAAWAKGANPPRMFVFGGYESMMGTPIADGYAYDPSNDSWSGLPSGPSARVRHVMAWSGSELLVWGGQDSMSVLNDGQKLTAAGSWLPMNFPAPGARELAQGAWVDGVKRLFLFGGDNAMGGYYGDAWEFDPTANSWGTPQPTAPGGRSWFTMVVAGSKVIVWGGDPGPTNSGAIFDTAFKP